jgi:hypothetical protein
VHRVVDFSFVRGLVRHTYSHTGAPSVDPVVVFETPPDHSILSKARKRYGPEAYRQFFNEIVRQCAEQGLVDGDRLYLDASLVKANASLGSLVSRPLYRPKRHSRADNSACREPSRRVVRVNLREAAERYPGSSAHRLAP